MLAFDYGASSGRAIKGIYDGKKISLKEIHRFSNDPVTVKGTMYWDTLRLFYEMKQGLLKAKLDGGFDSLGIDTWGVDFGLLDENGDLVGNPVHYRDARTNGMLEESFRHIDKESFYSVTGNQFMEINTAFQLLSIRLKHPEWLEQTDVFLFTPDLFNYFLTGIKRAEYSIASTSQLTDARGRCWSDPVINALGLPRRIFPEIIKSGIRLGTVSAEIRDELGLDPFDVDAICGHDTQCALVSVPTKEKDFIFISCGTWSLFGTELDSPVIDAGSEKYNITNEGGYGGKVSFLKNIIGLWLIQESRRQWQREGRNYGFAELEKMAAEETPFASFIDPDDPQFIPAGDIPDRIREYCKGTSQPVPDSAGRIVRCIDESLAFKYRDSLEQIRSCTGKEYQDIYVVGGGTQSELLCQMTANACHCRVYAGPVEATVYGNIAIQLMTSGEIEGIQQAREVISRSETIRVFEPQNKDAWEEAYGRYQKASFTASAK